MNGKSNVMPIPAIGFAGSVAAGLFEDGVAWRVVALTIALLVAGCSYRVESDFSKIRVGMTEQELILGGCENLELIESVLVTLNGFSPEAAAGEPADTPETSPGWTIARSPEKRLGEAGAAGPGPISASASVPP